MFTLSSRYTNIIVLACLCIVSLSLSWMTIGAARKAKTEDGSFKSKLSPILVPVHLCSAAVSAVWDRISYVASVCASVWRKPIEEGELQSLENQVEYLKRQLAEEKGRNRTRLEEIYQVCTNLASRTVNSDHNLKFVPANVIAVEPTDWFRYLTIDKGSKHGVNLDMAVINRSDTLTDELYLAGAIVGKVVDVQNYSAKVQLITDRLSVVAVTIGSQGDLVLLRGQPETESCVIDEVPSTAHEMLEEGYVVTVDERSSIFPPGMLVGRISSIEKGIHFCRVEVQPAFSFSKLREVMVVMDAGH